MTDRDKLELILETRDYDSATKAIAARLKTNLFHLLGADWKKIREGYGLYTINVRPKQADRTLDKFDRMRQKNHSITADNFYEHMADLAAARLLIVDPVDIFELAEKVRSSCTTPQFEPPGTSFSKCRLRHGELSAYNAKIVERFRNAGYTIETEDAGYCSVHFVFRIGKEFFPGREEEEHKCLYSLQTKKVIPSDQWHVEIQVRTLMEEAWGETDHFVRYVDPDLREDPAIVTHFAALSGYLQAANHHVSLIRKLAKEQRQKNLHEKNAVERGEAL